MKVVHWCKIAPGGVSGLLERVKELHLNEKLMGIDSGICSPSRDKRDGQKLVSSKGVTKADGSVTTGKVTFELKPWKWAEDADINVIDSHIPDDFERLRGRVFIAHGTPESCAYTELYEGKNTLSTAIRLIHDCELTVCWSKRHQRIWSLYDDQDKVKYVHGGIDLERWTSQGKKINFYHHPATVFMGMWQRKQKVPITTLYGIKRAYTQIHSLHLHLMNITPNQQLFWMKFICKLDLDKIVANFQVNPLVEPDIIYRGADILIDPNLYGDISGIGAEALACGCPVILFEGEEFANAKCKDDPEDMARAIVELWERMRDDPEKERKAAREIAEKHYDIKDTIKGMVKLYEELI